MAGKSSQRAALAFDIRTVIALLFAIYGVVLTIVGMLEPIGEKTKAAGLNINLWVGIGMIVFAVLMVVWAALSPVAVTDRAGHTES